MSVLYHLLYTGKPGAARAFAKEMKASGTVDSIRAEAGNLGYDYYQPLEDPDSILLVDCWESQEALDVHHASPMMKTIADLRDKYDLTMKATRLESGPEPESDPNTKFMRVKQES